MRKNLMKLMAAVFLLAAIAVVFFTFGRPLATIEGQPFVHADSGKSQVMEPEVKEVVPHAVQSMSPGKSNFDTNVDEILRSAKTKEEAYSLLVIGAETGDLESMLAIRNIRTKCLEFTRPERPGIADFAPKEARESSVWQATYDKWKNYCGISGELDERVDAIDRAWDEKIAMLASSGDQLATLMDTAVKLPGGLAGPEALQAVNYLRGRPGALAAEKAVSLLLMSNCDEIDEIDTRVFGSALSRQEQVNLKEAVAALYACGNGAYCGSGGEYQEYRCLLYGRCAPDLSLQNYMRQNDLSGSQYLMVQQYLAQLQTLIDGKR